MNLSTCFNRSRIRHLVKRFLKHDTNHRSIHHASRKLIAVILAAGIVFLLTNCVTVKRFDEFKFEDRPAAAVIMSPPRADIDTSSGFWIDPNDPVGSAFRLGAELVKKIEAEQARERLESALAKAELGETIRWRTLEGAADILDCVPVYDTKTADFLFDITIREYGIDASGQVGLDFKIFVEVLLLDTKRQETVWRRRIRERQEITPSVFGLDEAVGNVLTAVVLSQMSEEAMVQGFERLAELTAEKIVAKMRDDYIDVQYR